MILSIAVTIIFAAVLLFDYPRLRPHAGKLQKTLYLSILTTGWLICIWGCFVIPQPVLFHKRSHNITKGAVLCITTLSPADRPSVFCLYS